MQTDASLGEKACGPRFLTVAAVGQPEFLGNLDYGFTQP